MIYSFRNFKNVAYFAFGRGTFDRLDEILAGLETRWMAPGSERRCC